MGLLRIAPLALALSLPANAAAQEAIELKTETLEQQIDAAYAEHDLAGVLYLFKDGEVLLAKAYGLADPYLRSRLSSGRSAVSL